MVSRLLMRAEMVMMLVGQDMRALNIMMVLVMAWCEEMVS